MMTVMSKKKSNSEGAGEPAKQKDRHKGKAVRIPPDLVERMEALAKAGRRPISWELRAAVEAWLKENEGKTEKG